MASASSDQAENLKSQDINAKLKVVSNVVKACITESENKTLLNKLTHVYERTQMYTKADYYIIYKVKNSMRSERSFLGYITEKNSKANNILPYETYRDVYVDALLKKRVILTLKVFRDAPTIQPAHGRLRMELKEHDFIWARLPGTKKSMIIEKPERLRRRCEYLSKIAKYRSAGRNIIYIDERFTIEDNIFGEKNKRNKFSYFVMAVGKKGLLQVCFYSEQDYLRDTLTTIAEKLKEPTVFVVGEKKYHEKLVCPLPNPNSTKQVMSNFLTQNDICHDPDMPRAELYSIIERCKNSCKTEGYTQLDRLLSGHGHVILRRSDTMKDLNFFSKVWEVTMKNLKTEHPRRSDIMKTLRDMTSEDWLKLELDLIKAENRIFTEDVQIEETIDKIMMLAADGKIPDAFKSNGQGDLETDVDYSFENVVDF